MTRPGDPPDASGHRVVVFNPASGDAQHGVEIRSLANEYGYDVWETESAEDIVDKAAEAAREADVVAACGGDGTLTRAVRGLDRADAFEDTLFAVVPGGTGNNFAGNVGVTSLEHAFEVVESGDRRCIDVGVVDDTVFLNSCVAGLTAESSAETDSDEKERWGVLAYAMETVRTAREFDGLEMTVTPADDDPWECVAEVVLVGNGRRFPVEGRTQADMEDGELDVTVVEDVSTLDLVEESIENLFGRDTEHVRRFQTPDLELRFRGPPDRVSVDGEIKQVSTLSLSVRPRTLWLPVGDAYEPRPGE